MTDEQMNELIGLTLEDAPPKVKAYLKEVERQNCQDDDGRMDTLAREIIFS